MNFSISMSKKFRNQLAIATGVLAMVWVVALPAISQEISGEETPVVVESTIEGDVNPSAASTLEDLLIPLDELKLLVKPLTLEELETEANAWFLVLKAKVQEITQTEIAIKRQGEVEESSQAESEVKNDLIVKVTKLQAEQTALIDRLNVVLDELDKKGGDTTSYRKYIAAITGIDFDITSTEGIGLRFLNWLKSEEGGIRWGLSIFKFLVIVIVSIVAARILKKVVRTALPRVGRVSSLFLDFIVLTTERGVMVIGFLIALTSLGISLGPLLTLVGGVSFVLAFALQSNLGNLASGLMLLIYKPFDVGDRVLIPGTNDKGYVRAITLANTSFDHYTGKIVTLTNSEVWGSRIENLLPGEHRLIELLFMISSNDDARKIKAAWDKAIEAHPGVDKEKWSMSIPYISPSSGSLMYWCGAWAKKKGFWDVYTDILLNIWDDLKDSGISFGLAKGESYVHLTNEQVKFVNNNISSLSSIGREITEAKATPGEFVEPDDID